MKKIFTLLLLGFFLSPSSSFGQSLTVAVKDKYLVGKGVVLYNKPVIQTDMFIPLPAGFSLDLWWSSGFNKNLNSGFDDEVDYTVGWSGRVEEFNLSLGVSYYDLFKLGKVAGNVVSPTIEVSRDFQVADRHTLTPYFRSEILFPIEWRGVDAKSGAQLYLGLKHRWNLVSDVVDLKHTFAFDYDTGAFVKSDHGLLGDYNAALSWKLPRGITVDAPTFRVVFPISKLSDGRKAHEVFGVGVTIPLSAVRDLFK